jgi:hypothetical protein
MNRRLYFLLPDVAHTLKVVNELQQSSIKMRLHIKAGKGIERSLLPTELQDIHRDTEHLMGRVLWHTNLTVFFIALLVFIVALFMQWYVTAAIMVGIMIATFLMGLMDSMLPDVQLSEFDHALSHREILLMIDTSCSYVHKVEQLVHRHHPEAVVGGVSWHMGTV